MPNPIAKVIIRPKCLFDNYLGKSLVPLKFSYVAEKPHESIWSFVLSPDKGST